jgi:Flp pilus assembly protein TadG
MVEMALVAPLFMMIFFAGLEFARICMVRNAANNAAYQAARQIIIPGASEQQARDEVGRLLSVMGVTAYNMTVTPAVIEASTDRITVNIDIPAKDNGWMSAMFVTDLTLHANSTLFTERDTVY